QSRVRVIVQLLVHHQSDRLVTGLDVHFTELMYEEDSGNRLALHAASAVLVVAWPFAAVKEIGQSDFLPRIKILRLRDGLAVDGTQIRLTSGSPSPAASREIIRGEERHEADAHDSDDNHP